MRTMLLATSLVLFSAAAAHPAPPDHPAYLHALGDLRAARGYLHKPDGVVVAWDEKKARGEIDAAIKEIKDAAIDDGKDLDDHPAIDVADWGGRLRRAKELLAAAERDVSEDEDNGFARGLRKRAIGHIEGAERFVDEGIANAKEVDHPAYLHALTDLRAARGFLAKPAGTAVKWDEQQAIGQIDRALKDIKDAAIDDGKDLGDHPPIDIADWGGRLQKAKELLAAAQRDVAGDEDNDFARGVRKRALDHIARAQKAVEEGIVDAHASQREGGDQQPGAHPAYLHALTDLREARANLERPANVVVKWDEKKAIAQIDAAIKEIKDAAIDDGKDLGDHPAVDVALSWRGRLQHALELLEKSSADIREREDNAYARGLRKRALGHIDQAARFTREGIANAQ